MYRIYLALGRNGWSDGVKVVMNFRVRRNEGNFWSTEGTISLSKWILLHGVSYMFNTYLTNLELNSTTLHAIRGPKSSSNPHGILQGFRLVIAKPLLSCGWYYNLMIRDVPKNKFRTDCKKWIIWASKFYTLLKQNYKR